MNLYFSYEASIWSQKILSFWVPVPFHSVTPLAFLSFITLSSFPNELFKEALSIYFSKNVPECKSDLAPNLICPSWCLPWSWSLPQLVFFWSSFTVWFSITFISRFIGLIIWLQTVKLGRRWFAIRYFLGLNCSWTYFSSFHTLLP